MNFNVGEIISHPKGYYKFIINVTMHKYKNSDFTLLRPMTNSRAYLETNYKLYTNIFSYEL